MRKTLLFRAVACAVAMFSLIVLPSCIDEKYTLSKENFDWSMHVFQEGICLPLGSMDTITLGALIQKLDLPEDFQRIFQVGEDGAYSFSYGPETKDMSEHLSSLSEVVDIAKIDFSKSVDFNLDGVDVGDIRYEGKTYGFEKDLSDEIAGMDVSIPPIDSPFQIDANIRSFGLGDMEWELGADNHGVDPNFAYVPESLEIPAVLLEDASLRNHEMSVEELNGYLKGGKIGLNATVENLSVSTEMKNSFPKEVLSVSDVHVADGAKLRVTVAINDPFFTGGRIIPHLDVNLSSVFHLYNDGVAVHDDHIDSDFVLSADNEIPWTVVEEYDIEGLVIDPEKDWIYPDMNDPESVLQLNKMVEIEIEGKLRSEGLKTTLGALDTWIENHPVVAGRRNLDVQVNVEFVEFSIDDATMEFRPKQIERQDKFDIKIPAMSLPTSVSRVENIEFTETSIVNFTLSAENLAEIGEVDLELNSLELVFPEKFIVEGADDDNKLVFDAVNLREQTLSENIVIKGYKLDAPDANGHVPEYVGTVDVIAKGEISGEVRAANLPKTETDDVILKGTVTGALEIENYDAVLKGYEANSQTDPDLFKAEEIKIEIPESLSEVEGLVVNLKNDPAIEINITVPETSFDIRPLGEQDLVISFPTMIQFEEGANYEKWFDRGRNALVFSSEEEFPSETIIMPIRHIVINPEKGDDGKWYSVGEVKIDGAVGIKEGVIVTKDDLDELSGKAAVVKLEAVIPDLEPETVGAESYTTPIDLSFEFAPFKDVELPEMLKSVNDIIMDDVYLSLDVKTGEGFPSIGDGATLALGLDVVLPEYIKVEDSRFKNGKLEISDEFVKTADGLSLVMDPIRIGGLELNMSREQLSALADSIFINGNITLTGAELDIDEWTGKSHSIDVVADIKTEKHDASSEDKVLIKEITGVVDYTIDPVDFPIDLSEITSTLQGENLSVALDIKTFYLALGVKTNLGVPVKADLYITPYFGGEARTPAHQSLALEPATSSELKETRYWISNTAPAEGLGYEYLDGLNLFDILFADSSRTVMADSLKISLVAATDSQQECRFEPGAEYQLAVDYMAGIPLELGENFKLEYRHVIEDFDSGIIQLFKYGSIGLGGSVENSIPLNFNLQVNMLDEEGNAVDMGEGIGAMSIKGGSGLGEPVKTPISLVLGNKAGSDVPEIVAMELVFSADAKGISGPFTEKSSLRCVLNALIPEGISVDLWDTLKDSVVEDTQE